MPHWFMLLYRSVINNDNHLLKLHQRTVNVCTVLSNLEKTLGDIKLKMVATDDVLHCMNVFYS